MTPRVESRDIDCVRVNQGEPAASGTGVAPAPPSSSSVLRSWLAKGIAMRRGSSICVLAIMILPIAFFSAHAEPAKNPTHGKKVIEWGWDEPDTKFMRENI